MNATNVYEMTSAEHEMDEGKTFATKVSTRIVRLGRIDDAGGRSEGSGCEGRAGGMPDTVLEELPLQSTTPRSGDEDVIMGVFALYWRSGGSE